MGVFTDWLHMGFWPIYGHNRQDRYPLDLDGSLRYTRPKTGYDYWPTHSNYDNFQQLGYVSGFLPEMDTRVWSQLYGRWPSGPSVNPLPLNLQWQITVPGLTKGATNLGGF